MVALSGYSRLDRLVHRVAFASPAVQLGAADLEAWLFRKEIEASRLAAPVFVTSLPRAGTTALLLALATLPSMATHLYRDMPMVMAPLLWSRLSAPFQKAAVPAERAHGDGIEIGYDSPEAFDEIVWRALWPDHYGEKGLALWTAADASAEATAFMTAHHRKVAALRRPGAAAVRYLSKNNNNIARLDLLPMMFPGAAIVVPIRAPVEHALSLHRQHRNFTARHADDKFTRRYMADIGHLEFGALHKPILFDGFADLAEGLGPNDLDYWLAYWIAAFEHVRARRRHLCLVVYEHLCRDAEAARSLCREIGFDEAEAPAVARQFSAPARASAKLPPHRLDLRERAETLYHHLAEDPAAADAGPC